MEIAKSIAPICLAIIMFGLGLGLTVQDFLRVIKNPKDFLIGFLSQVILLPIVAIILISLISLPIEIAMGVMIIAAAPGGVTSNILTKFADGDVALSVTLTAVVSLLSIITVPLIVFNSANYLSIEIVKEIDNATSPSANLVNIFDVTPPGAAAIIITPIAISGGDFKMIINK